MPFEKPGKQVWGSAAFEDVDPARFNDLAGWCEQLTATEQRAGFDRVLREIGTNGVVGDPDRTVAQFADAGAFESAAIALIPQSAFYTGGRMKDGTFAAQVVPEGGTGAHSRNARSLAMAWLAALLRALARQCVEARSASAG